MLFAPRFCSPAHSYNPCSAATWSPWGPSFDVIDTSLLELKRNARPRNTCQRPAQHRFDVRETTEAYRVSGEVPGFDQQNIDISVSGEDTLNIKASFEKREGSAEPQEAAPANPEGNTSKQHDQSGEKAPDTSAVEVQPRHQATVEDDFEDLGNDSDAGATSKHGKEAESEPSPESPNQVANQTQPSQEISKTDGRKLLSERHFGAFSRTFQFPARINGEGVQASLNNGVLSVIVPKAPIPEVRHIAIQSQ